MYNFHPGQWEPCRHSQIHENFMSFWKDSNSGVWMWGFTIVGGLSYKYQSAKTGSIKTSSWNSDGLPFIGYLKHEMSRKQTVETSCCTQVADLKARVFYLTRRYRCWRRSAFEGLGDPEITFRGRIEMQAGVEKERKGNFHRTRKSLSGWERMGGQKGAKSKEYERKRRGRWNGKWLWKQEK